MARAVTSGDSPDAAGSQEPYSPRNPRSDLFGKIGRNTPIRVREDAAGDTYLVMPGFNDSYVSTPDIADLDDTTDIELRIDIEPTTRRPTDGFGLARKYVLTSDQRTWALWLNEAGRSEEHTSEFQTLMRISYAVLRLKKIPHHTPPSPA